MDANRTSDELEAYRAEQAESWLSKVRRLRLYRDSLERQALDQMELLDGLKGIDYSRPSVTTSPYRDAIPDMIAARESAAENLRELARDASERMADAAVRLSRMADPTEALCLQLYYCEGVDTWERVCVTMSYSYDGMMKLRRRALAHAYAVMPHTERDAAQPAL